MWRLVVLESYQTYQNGAVSYQLTDAGRGGGGGLCVFDSESVAGVLYWWLNINQPLPKWEVQIRHYLYCTSLWFSLVVYQWFNRSVRKKAKLASPLHNGLIASQNFFDSIAKIKRRKKKNKFVTPEEGEYHKITK
jgi:hypothetical protein